ncbi:HAD family hydrolase [Laceyella putida]|uniref:HAD family hydrolase n=1 Tax=Laceyella putida TaxID=110101 RepID=A0ABW2RFK5_9BACL
MRKFLDLLKGAGYPLAVASGSSAAIIGSVLKQTGLQTYFDVVLSSEEVPRGKPAPDVFLEAAKRLGVAPEHCVVMEDSQYGVEAAKAAGMGCVAIPYLTDRPLAEPFLQADFLCEDGMDGFSADETFHWLRQSHT